MRITLGTAELFGLLGVFLAVPAAALVANCDRRVFIGPAVIYILLRRVSRNLPNKLSLQLKALLLKLDTSRKVLSTELVQSIQPKKVGMFWKSFLKLLKALMDGRCVLAKNSK